MNKHKGFLIAMAAVCVLIAAVLIAGAVAIYREGAARKAADPLESIYTAEDAEKNIVAALPLFFSAAAMLVIGAALGISAPEAGRFAGTGGPVKQGTELKHAGIIRAAVVVAAAGFIIAGILNGSAADVLIKAINICSECIGLG